jgi:predicted helicase
MTKAKIYYAQVDDSWTKQEKLGNLEKLVHIGNVQWQEITPDAKHTWLTEGLEDEFYTFLSIGNREGKESSTELETIFKNYGRGVATCRDSWAYNFSRQDLIENIKRMIETYNEQLFKWNQSDKNKKELDDFLIEDDHKIILAVNN